MSKNSAQAGAIEVTESNLSELINADTPALIDFWAPWCSPCKALAPTIDELAHDFDGQASVGKLNVDEHPSLAAKFGVSSIPSVLIFKNGKITQTLIGLRPKDTYANALNAT